MSGNSRQQAPACVCAALLLAVSAGAEETWRIRPEMRLPPPAALSGERVLCEARLSGPITKQLKGVHPRIYLTAEKIERLRRDTRTDARWSGALAELFRIADRGVKDGPPDYEAAERRNRGSDEQDEQLWQRDVGNMIPHLALAFLLSDNRKYLDECRKWIFAALSYKTWGLGTFEGLDLATGHQLTGIGLAYDWLHQHLSAAERQRIREGLTERAGRMARAAMVRGIWWHKSYMQNHQWVNCAGMATAGFAVCDEVPEAAGWIRLAHEKFLKTLDTLGDDGASHEGYGYWEYGAEYIMRYMEMARELLGIDLYRSGNAEHPWLLNNPLYALHLATPRALWTRQQCIIDIGDCPRYHWHGPTHLPRNLARRFPRSPYSGFAQWLAGEIEGAGHAHPDAGHFVFFYGGEFMVRDDGYSHHKLTADHNCVLFDGSGQKGDGKTWLDMDAWLKDRRAPAILEARSEGGRDVIVCDVAVAYPPGIGIEQFVRRFEFRKPDTVIVDDTIRLGSARQLEWRLHVEGTLEKQAARRFLATGKKTLLAIAVTTALELQISTGRRGDEKSGSQFLSIRYARQGEQGATAAAPQGAASRGTVSNRRRQSPGLFQECPHGLRDSNEAAGRGLKTSALVASVFRSPRLLRRRPCRRAVRPATAAAEVILVALRGPLREWYSQPPVDTLEF